MADELTDEELRAKAESRVKQKVRLLYSIGVWVAVSLFMFVIWLLSGRGYQWFWWVVGGMGFAVVLQVVGYFSGNRGEATRDRMIEREMERMKK
jgi:phosphotransferase system  glucose/maltose/N-acetylglucosamine-specific IIC component